MEFLRQHSGEITRLLIEHLWLTGWALAIAVLIAVPTGILLTRKPALAKPVIGFANVLQTIPSLALFGLLLPVPFFGDSAARLAIVALTGYALLPILRNTYAGVRSIEPSLTNIGIAIGMSKLQVLFKVELPLSASVILAGIRTAAVTCVGVATIAAAIGAGGLGELIFRGVASVDNRLVLAGAVPAALLALFADGVLGFAEKRLAHRYNA
ncbi:MAG: ABC transporter permease [Acidobacteria bacterium]|nr:ABC transporter permease [Acidobacteriota bacterium]